MLKMTMILAGCNCHACRNLRVIRKVGLSARYRLERDTRCGMEVDDMTQLYEERGKCGGKLSVDDEQGDTKVCWLCSVA